MQSKKFYISKEQVEVEFFEQDFDQKHLLIWVMRGLWLVIRTVRFVTFDDLSKVENKNTDGDTFFKNKKNSDLDR